MVKEKYEKLSMWRISINQDLIFVYIMYSHADNKYHFVNFTQNYICAHGFDTIEDAVADLEQYKKNGKIKDYQNI